MPVQPGLSDLVGNTADRFSCNVAKLCLAKESHENYKVCFYVELKKKIFLFILSSNTQQRGFLKYWHKIPSNQ